MPIASACPRKNGEIGAAGKPDARPSAPTAPFDSFLGQSPSPHGGPSPSFSARRHSHPPPTNDHPRLGAVRRRPIRTRIAANNARGTRHLRQLERDGLGMADDLGPDPDQLLPQRRQRPCPHGSGQRQLTQEVPQVVRQGEQLQADLVVLEPAARQPRPLGSSRTTGRPLTRTWRPFRTAGMCSTLSPPPSRCTGRRAGGSTMRRFTAGLAKTSTGCGSRRFGTTCGPRIKAAGMDWTAVIAAEDENPRQRSRPSFWPVTSTPAPRARVAAFVEQGGGCRANFFNYRRKLGNGTAGRDPVPEAGEDGLRGSLRSMHKVPYHGQRSGSGVRGAWPLSFCSANNPTQRGKGMAACTFSR